jgi:hypothetical protein
MNFARTNLSLLLARQNRQPLRGAAAPCRLPTTRVVAAPVFAPAAAVPASPAAIPLRQALEVAGALAMMAAFLVLALFG